MSHGFVFNWTSAAGVSVLPGRQFKYLLTVNNARSFRRLGQTNEVRQERCLDGSTIQGAARENQWEFKRGKVCSFCRVALVPPGLLLAEGHANIRRVNVQHRGHVVRH